MKTTLLALTIAAMPLSALAFDDLSGPGIPVGCCDPNALWALLDAEDTHDSVLLAKLMTSRCHSLAGVRYLLEEQRDGISRVRVFPDAGDWSTSWIAYTLDEMLDPDQEMELQPPARVPTGQAAEPGPVPLG